MHYPKPTAYNDSPVLMVVNVSSLSIPIHPPKTFFLFTLAKINVVVISKNRIVG